MKYATYILIFLISLNCSTQNELNNRNSTPKKFVFKKSLVSKEIDSSTIYSQTDYIILSQNDRSKDSITKKIREEILKVNFIPESQSIEIHIDVQNDSIWRHMKENGKMIGDYFMIQKNSGILNFYDKSKSVNYRKYDLFAENHKYEIIEDKKDRKEINGFDCYKLTLTKIDTKSDLGNTIYEMYVTDKIELPLHAVINLTTLVPNTFPMEIRISEEKLSGMVEQYELIKIE